MKIYPRNAPTKQPWVHQFQSLEDTLHIGISGRKSRLAENYAQLILLHRWLPTWISEVCYMLFILSWLHLTLSWLFHLCYLFQILYVMNSICGLTDTSTHIFIVVSKREAKVPCPNFVQIHSKKIVPYACLWTSHSGLNTRMTCSKASIWNDFFGANLDEIWTWPLNKGSCYVWMSIQCQFMVHKCRINI